MKKFFLPMMLVVLLCIHFYVLVIDATMKPRSPSLYNTSVPMNCNPTLAGGFPIYRLLTAPSGSFSSDPDGEGSQNYERTAACFWLINCSSAMGTEGYVPIFNILFDSLSRDDTVNIYWGLESNSSMYELSSVTKRNVVSPGIILLTGGSPVYVDFRSRTTSTTRGFSIRWQCVPLELRRHEVANPTGGDSSVLKPFILPTENRSARINIDYDSVPIDQREQWSAQHHTSPINYQQSPVLQAWQFQLSCPFGYSTLHWTFHQPSAITKDTFFTSVLRHGLVKLSANHPDVSKPRYRSWGTQITSALVNIYRQSLPNITIQILFYNDSLLSSPLPNMPSKDAYGVSPASFPNDLYLEASCSYESKFDCSAKEDLTTGKSRVEQVFLYPGQVLGISTDEDPLGTDFFPDLGNANVDCPSGHKCNLCHYDVWCPRDRELIIRRLEGQLYYVYLRGVQTARNMATVGIRVAAYNWDGTLRFETKESFRVAHANITFLSANNQQAATKGRQFVGGPYRITLEMMRRGGFISWVDHMGALLMLECVPFRAVVNERNIDVINDYWRKSPEFQKVVKMQNENSDAGVLPAEAFIPDDFQLPKQVIQKDVFAVRVDNTDGFSATNDFPPVGISFTGTSFVQLHRYTFHCGAHHAVNFNLNRYASRNFPTAAVMGGHYDRDENWKKWIFPFSYNMKLWTPAHENFPPFRRVKACCGRYKTWTWRDPYGSTINAGHYQFSAGLAFNVRGPLTIEFNELASLELTKNHFDTFLNATALLDFDVRCSRLGINTPPILPHHQLTSAVDFSLQESKSDIFEKLGAVNGTTQGCVFIGEFTDEFISTDEDGGTISGNSGAVGSTPLEIAPHSWYIYCPTFSKKLCNMTFYEISSSLDVKRFEMKLISPSDQEILNETTKATGIQLYWDVLADQSKIMVTVVNVTGVALLYIKSKISPWATTPTAGSTVGFSAKIFSNQTFREIETMTRMQTPTRSSSFTRSADETFSVELTISNLSETPTESLDVLETASKVLTFSESTSLPLPPPVSIPERIKEAIVATTVAATVGAATVGDPSAVMDLQSVVIISKFGCNPHAENGNEDEYPASLQAVMEGGNAALYPVPLLQSKTYGPLLGNLLLGILMLTFHSIAYYSQLDDDNEAHHDTHTDKILREYDETSSKFIAQQKLRFPSLSLKVLYILYQGICFESLKLFVFMIYDGKTPGGHVNTNFKEEEMKRAAKLEVEKQKRDVWTVAPTTVMPDAHSSAPPPSSSTPSSTVAFTASTSTLPSVTTSASTGGNASTTNSTSSLSASSSSSSWNGTTVPPTTAATEAPPQGFIPSLPSFHNFLSAYHRDIDPAEASIMTLGLISTCLLPIFIFSFWARTMRHAKKRGEILCVQEIENAKKEEERKRREAEEILQNEIKRKNIKKSMLERVSKNFLSGEEVGAKEGIHQDNDVETTASSCYFSGSPRGIATSSSANEGRHHHHKKEDEQASRKGKHHYHRKKHKSAAVQNLSPEDRRKLDDENILKRKPLAFMAYDISKVPPSKVINCLPKFLTWCLLPFGFWQPVTERRAYGVLFNSANGGWGRPIYNSIFPLFRALFLAFVAVHGHFSCRMRLELAAVFPILQCISLVVYRPARHKYSYIFSFAINALTAALILLTIYPPRYFSEPSSRRSGDSLSNFLLFNSSSSSTSASWNHSTYNVSKNLTTTIMGDQKEVGAQFNPNDPNWKYKQTTKPSTKGDVTLGDIAVALSSVVVASTCVGIFVNLFEKYWIQPRRKTDEEEEDQKKKKKKRSDKKKKGDSGGGERSWWTSLWKKSEEEHDKNQSKRKKEEKEFEKEKSKRSELTNENHHGDGNFLLSSPLLFDSTTKRRNEEKEGCDGEVLHRSSAMMKTAGGESLLSVVVPHEQPVIEEGKDIHIDDEGGGANLLFIPQHHHHQASTTTRPPPLPNADSRRHFYEKMAEVDQLGQLLGQTNSYFYKRRSSRTHEELL